MAGAAEPLPVVEVPAVVLFGLDEGRSHTPRFLPKASFHVREQPLR
jgi:hypothetical protein